MLSWGFDDIWGYLDQKILGVGASCWLGSARAGHCLCRGGLGTAADTAPNDLGMGEMAM